MNLSLPLFDWPDDLPGEVPVRPAPPDAAAPSGPGLGSCVAAGAGGDVLVEGASVEPGDAADEPDAADAADDPPAWVPLALDLALHPAVWRAAQLGGGPPRVCPTGFDALDAQLPGGGWPQGVLTELLLAQPGIGELRLLAPALAAIGASGDAPGQQRRAAVADGGGRCVMLFDPPAALSAWALAQCGLDSRHWLVVQARAGQGRGGAVPLQGVGTGLGAGAGPVCGAWRPESAPGVPRGANRLAPLLPGADVLWALEQSLKSGHVGAVLAWLPVNLRADALRRLQLAAQAHAGPVFIFRDALARSRPSAAPLRLLLQPAGVDGLSLRILKRRGPALAQPLRLALPPVLAPHLQARAEVQRLVRAGGQTALPTRRGAGPLVVPVVVPVVPGPTDSSAD